MTIRILQFLEDEINQNDIKESERLYNEYQALRNQKLGCEELEELNQKIWELHEQYRRYQAIGEATSLEGRELAVSLTRAKAKKSNLKYDRRMKTEMAGNKLQPFNSPFIEKLKKQFDFRIEELEKKKTLNLKEYLGVDYSPKEVTVHDTLNKGIKTEFVERPARQVYEVETNLDSLEKVRELLIEGKVKLSSFNSLPLSQLMGYVKTLDEKINAINIKDLEKVKMTKAQYESADSTIGRK